MSSDLWLEQSSLFIYTVMSMLRWSGQSFMIWLPSWDWLTEPMTLNIFFNFVCLNPNFSSFAKSSEGKHCKFLLFSALHIDKWTWVLVMLLSWMTDRWTSWNCPLCSFSLDSKLIIGFIPAKKRSDDMMDPIQPVCSEVPSNSSWKTTKKIAKVLVIPITNTFT